MPLQVHRHATQLHEAGAADEAGVHESGQLRTGVSEWGHERDTARGADRAVGLAGRHGRRG